MDSPRTSPWAVAQQTTFPSGLVRLTMTLSDTQATRMLWPYGFLLEVAITVGGPSLEVNLLVVNTGDLAFDFTCALHTYLRTSRTDAHISGLRGLPFIDGTDGGRVTASDDAWLYIDQEIERYYYGASTPVALAAGASVVTVRQQAFGDTVIWNPWDRASDRFPDLPTDGFKHFVCIESAAFERRVHLMPGARWQGGQRLDFENTGTR
jgi:glucose-6-phosphate 1-epimerase